MLPELFTIPFINISIKSYGFMMVLGFLAALLMAKRRAKKMGVAPQIITDFSIMILLAGVIGARLHYILHRWNYYGSHLREIFDIASGGLEFLGGFILASLVTAAYFHKKRLPVLKMLDIIAPAVMLGLAFGRIGCFLNGCCYGGPSELPWAVRFPVVNTHTAAGCEKKQTLSYSHPYYYQITPDTYRHAGEPPMISLPDEYYGYTDGQGHWLSDAADLPRQPQAQNYYYSLKTPDQLTDSQLAQMRQGSYRMHRIHPTQLYSVANALGICLILNWMFRRYRFPGQIFGWMLLLYGFMRFWIEAIRVDSPLEFNGLTISQNMGIAATAAGAILLIRQWRKHHRSG